MEPERRRKEDRYVEEEAGGPDAPIGREKQKWRE